MTTNMRWLRRWVHCLLHVLLVTAAFSHDALAPADTGERQIADRAKITIEPNVVYATVDGHKLMLDLYLPPAGPTKGRRPGILAIHGGGMRGGDKASWKAQSQYLARHGMVVASVNYRLSKVARFPASIHDCKAAVRWLRAHADKYRIDPDKIGAVGSSAGGYLTAMLAATHDEQEFEGNVGELGFSSRVQAAVPLAPPADLLLRAQLIPDGNPTKAYAKYLGKTPEEDPRLWEFGSPVNHVDDRTAPMLIMHATGDPLTPHRVAAEFYEKCKNVGAPAEFVSVESHRHSFCNPRSEHYEDCMKRIVTFFEKCFQNEQRGDLGDKGDR